MLQCLPFLLKVEIKVPGLPLFPRHLGVNETQAPLARGGSKPRPWCLAEEVEHRLDFSLNSLACLSALHIARLYTGVLQSSCNDLRVPRRLLPPFLPWPHFLPLISLLSSHTGLLAILGVPGRLLPQGTCTCCTSTRNTLLDSHGLASSPHLLQLSTQTPSSQAWSPYQKLQPTTLPCLPSLLDISSRKPPSTYSPNAILYLFIICLSLSRM